MSEPHCPSVNTLAPNNNLVSTECVLDKGHRGKCHDHQGHEWYRASEYVRMLREDHDHGVT
jgi:hypothetical protein